MLLPAGCPTRSPWGTIQSATAIGPFWQVSTAGHGGIKVPAELNRLIPAPHRRAGGWYEEDCEWSIVAIRFPEHFSEAQRKNARDQAIHWYPDAFEAITGEKIPEGASRARNEERFRRESADKYVVVSAYGDWHETVPKGMAGVCASQGGSRAPGTPQAWFLVPIAEYKAGQGSFGFIIDESRHQPWKDHP